MQGPSEARLPGLSSGIDPPAAPEAGWRTRAEPSLAPLRPAHALGALIARPILAIAIAFGLVVAIALFDYITVYEARLGILYLVPVALATASGGRRWGWIMSVVGVSAWGLSSAAQHAYSNEVYFYWECLMLAVTLLLFVELLTRLQHALARSDERFVRVLNGLHAAVFVTDPERVLFANEWLLRLLGRGVTPTVSDIANRFPNARLEGEVPDAPVQAPFAGTEVRDAVNGRTYLAQAGGLNWVDGRRVRLTILTDITEQKRAEALQRENQASLHHTARLVNLAEAATTLAHELNQPLNAILGYNAACLRLLDEGDADPGELAAAMEKCRVQAGRAGDIIQRIRELTRKRTPTLSPCDLNAMLQEVLGWLADDLERNAVRVDLRLAEGLPRVRADRILVEQVMLNLVNNAMEAMATVPSGQRAIEAVTERAGPDGARITITDRGPGITAEHAARMFTPFFTTKTQGLGLGLAICRSVVEMHGGRLWHEPRQGGGTAFHFSLPAGAS